MTYLLTFFAGSTAGLIVASLVAAAKKELVANSIHTQVSTHRINGGKPKGSLCISTAACLASNRCNGSRRHGIFEKDTTN